MTPLPQLEPRDPHNRRLEQNVHPPDWTNPTPAGRYNLVVIGAGTAGLVAAAGAAGLGARVALIERERMGGDCLNVGCVPSKALISAARAAAAVRNSTRFGIHLPEGVTVNFTAAMERMRKLRADISPADSAQRFRSLGIDVFLGSGRFTTPTTIEVAGQTLTFKKALIATGARAAAPTIPGLDQVDYLTNETLFSLTELPPNLGIIGAGPIGCEMAQAFARFGSNVHLVESTHGILPREDPDAARSVLEQMTRDGVSLLCCGRDLRLAKTGQGIRMTLRSHNQEHSQIVDQLLVAAGRAPNVTGLGLETAGVEFDPSTGVRVNDRLQTTHPNIYAAGDVCSPHKFTHAADFAARIVIQNALFMGRAKASALTVPWCTYTSPELAHVGLTAADAEKSRLPIDTFTQNLEHVDRAILEGETNGFVRVHVRKGTDTIVGATIVAANAGDMIGSLSIAMTHGIGLKKIGSTIHPYPTQGEAVRKVGDLYNRTRLTPRVKSIMTRWLAWTR